MSKFSQPRRAAGLQRVGRRRLRLSWIESLECRALLSGASAEGYVGSIAPPTAPFAAKGDWTVMVYVTATDLAENARANIVEMEKAAAKLPVSVKIVVLYDQWANVDDKGASKEMAAPGSKGAWKNAPGALTYPTGSGTQAAWSTAGITIIAPHAPADGQRITSNFAISTSEVNTGDSAVLRNFILQAAKAAPADHYGLVIWDHGGGVSGFNVDSHDVLPKDELTTNELASALDAAAGQGVRIDLVGFDACLMATTEVAHALRDRASILVASEETIGGDGWNYETALDALIAQPNASPRDLARSMVTSFQNRYRQKEAGRSPYATDHADTLSAIDLGGMAGLDSALRTFSASTAAASPRDWSTIVSAYRKTPYFGGRYKELYRDLGRFANSVAATAPSPAIRNAARGVAAAVGSMVFARTADQRQTSGLSIGLPPRSTGLDSDYLTQINGSRFGDASDWPRFQTRFLQAAARSRDMSGEPNWAYNDHGTNTALDLKTLVGKRLRVPALAIAPGATAWFKFRTSTIGSRGDLIRAVGSSEINRLQLKVIDPGNPLSVLIRGEGAVSLRDLEPDEYLLAVTAPAGRHAVRFGLMIQAPSASPLPTDVPETNISMGEAADLGTIHGALLVPNQSRSSADRVSWYSFEPPRSETPHEAKVSLITDGRPQTLTLLDADGYVLKRASGTLGVHLTHPVRGGGESYYLKVEGGPGAFSLFFDDNQTA